MSASSTTARDVENLIYRSDRGVLSIRYTERLTEAGIEASVGSIGDSCHYMPLAFFSRRLLGICRCWRDRDSHRVAIPSPSPSKEAAS